LSFAPLVGHEPMIGSVPRVEIRHTGSSLSVVLLSGRWLNRRLSKRLSSLKHADEDEAHPTPAACRRRPLCKRLQQHLEAAEEADLISPIKTRPCGMS